MPLNRRAALLALLSLPLGDYRALSAQSGVLTIDLNKWRGLRVTHGKESIDISGQDIFEALTGKE